ncbi:MAG: Stp1/IreP family PP2C-type Ser/Thr phosphatase [Solirubrobacterales bacterium]
MLRVVDFASSSDVGRVRKANEDSFFVRSPLFVVADGMGGAQAGEVASKIAADAFRAPLNDSLAPEQRLAQVVQSANLEIHNKSVSDADFQGMGTTLTALLLGDDDVTVAHVGDSRAYRLRDGELIRLTDDHSLVGEMVRRGAITEAEAEVHPQRSILTRALGPEADVEVDTLSYAVKDGDAYLICSDGLTGMVSDAEIAEQLGSGRSMREVADNLIRSANENGGVDNITVVAFKVSGGTSKIPAPPTADTGEATVVGAPRVEMAPPPVATEETLTTNGSQDSVSGTRTPQTVAASTNGELSSDERSTRAANHRLAQTKRSRRWVGGVIIAGVLMIAISGAVIGALNVYFIGANEKGLVTVYRGLPYELPLSLDLYTRDYVTTTPVSDLTEEQRAVIFDHTLRTRSDALDLANQIERGELESIASGERDDQAAPQAPGDPSQ